MMLAIGPNSYWRSYTILSAAALLMGDLYSMSELR